MGAKSSTTNSASLAPELERRFRRLAIEEAYFVNYLVAIEVAVYCYEAGKPKWKLRPRGETNMKHLFKLMLLTFGIGVIAVIMLSLPRHTVSAAGPSNTLVTLWYNFGSSCFVQILATGTNSTECYVVPTDNFLVVTDIQFTCLSGPAGGSVQIALDPFNGGGPYTAIVQPDSNGNAFLQSHLTTGLVFRKTPSLTVYQNPTGCFPSITTLQGYGSATFPTH